ncbi:hypothetical protein KP509_04G004200 [Ceratopteris richardii]|uniref:DUF3700 domain-containing protein n=1 Tax=Ceratopteris richardii TaxID=49495 RepID=A0A8T2UWA4_CERRI|nr:hypothetical protein KP509_04G004200 [Ceratopteris richardii]
MLAIFGSTVANAPQELSSPCSSKTLRESRKSGNEILEIFMKEMPDAVQITLSDVTGLAYTHAKQSLLAPRSFAMTDGVFCLFQGALKNLTALRQVYGLPKNVNEVMFLIQAYKTLRDRGLSQLIGSWRLLVGVFSLFYSTQSTSLFLLLRTVREVSLYIGGQRRIAL